MNISGISVNGAMTGAQVAAARPRQTASPQGQEATDAVASSAQVKQMVDEMQSQIDSMNVSLTFSTYGDRGENIAVVVANKDTGKIIREIPPKELQNLHAKMSEMAGLIFNHAV